MSKKMMKRSLALGALMAFVITGSAWANDLDGWSWSQDDWLYTVDSSSNSEGIIPKGEYNGVMFVGEGVVSVGYVRYDCYTLVRINWLVFSDLDSEVGV